MNCKHEDFEASVKVNRLGSDADLVEGNVNHWVADIQVHCKECELPFSFLGVPLGLNFEAPSANIDRTELHAPMVPGPAKPEQATVVYGKPS